MRDIKALSIVVLYIFLHISSFTHAAILSTSSRWIVNQNTGNRAKLICASWASHLEPMIAEGLDKKPLVYIVWQIRRTGLNCVRFTWPLFMFTRPEVYNITVSQSLDKYNLTIAKAGIMRNNPWILCLKIQKLHKVVVNYLGMNNIMVVLDNHLSRPGWCCGFDGNGFFGDEFFNPNEWLQGLATVADTYKYSNMVVGMSLRNELRGYLEDVDVWYEYMLQGAMVVHQQNPQLLVIVSGLNFDTDLSFLQDQPFSVNFTNKTVFEAHWYGFYIPKQLWIGQTNKFCADVTRTSRNNFLFLTSGTDPYPLFLSEFGLDQGGVNEGENRYLTCLLAEMADKDLDWALWALQGSYMLRQGKVNVNETYGLMDFNWDRPRNPDFWARFQLLRQLNIEAKSSRSISYIIFHPQSGLCVQIWYGNKIFLSNCASASRWNLHQDGGLIKLARSQLCLNAGGDGSRAYLSTSCSRTWKVASIMGLQLATQVEPGKYLCLEKNILNTDIVTKECLCVNNKLGDLDTCETVNPQTQWFKFVITNM